MSEISGSIRRDRLQYSDVVHFIKENNIRGASEYRALISSGRFPGLPLWPERACADEWEGWRALCHSHKSAMVSFDECRKIAQEHSVIDRNDWKKKHSEKELPSNVPFAPHTFYKDEWLGWRDFLGKRRINKRSEFLPFNEARLVARTLGPKSFRDWHAANKTGKIPDNLPADPPKSYKDEWLGWSDFLGTNNVANHKRCFVDFDVACQYAISLNLHSAEQWREYVAENELPEGHPRTPHSVYRKEFKERGGWRAFLGNEYMSFDEAKAFIAEKKFRSWTEFRKWAGSSDRPKNFPSQPHSHPPYVPLWVNYPDFLGYGSEKDVNRSDKNSEEAKKRVLDLLREYPDILGAIKKTFSLS